MESALLDLKLTPDDIEIPVPRFYIEENKKLIEEREECLNSLNAKTFIPEETVKLFQEFTLEEAVLIIQRNERGRQGRLRAKYMKDIKMQEQNETTFNGNEDEMEAGAAALKIQKVWRGYIARKEYVRRSHEEMAFLEMIYQPRNAPDNPFTKLSANMNRRKGIQGQYEEDYQAALVNIKEKIRKVEGPDMKETWQDNFRQWYMEYKREIGKFPEFPSQEEWDQPGFKFGQKPAVQKEEVNETEAAKPSSAGSKKKQESSTSKKDGKGGKSKTEQPEGPIIRENSSVCLTSIKKTNEIYRTIWKSKDETDNFAQKHDPEIIKLDKRAEVEKEIKAELFILLNEELKNLILSVEKDAKGKKGKKGKNNGKKKGKKSKKEGGGKKGKKEKDLTAGRTEKSLVEELVQSGIMQKYTKVPLSEFKGQFNLMCSYGNNNKTIIDPSYSDLKHVITEYCILPLGLPVGNDSVKLPTTFLFYGPSGVGKSMLVRAVATEVGASFFNLTPKNTAGQFTGKASTAKMVHMVFKVAKLRAPSVIYIDDAETIFAKKVPKDDTSDPKRIRKDLAKNIANLKSSDRVIVIGNSRMPFEAETKNLSEVFQKFIYVPKPNFGCLVHLWEQFVLRLVIESNISGLKQNWLKGLNLPMLARMSIGLTGADIASICERVLTPRRVRLLFQRPLRNVEFINQMILLKEPNKQVDADFKEWASKLPLARKRAALSGTETSVAGDDKNKKKNNSKK